MTLKWCHLCKKDDDAEEILEQFELPFPEGYEHIICSHAPLERPGDFRATLKIKLRTQDDAQTWLKAFESSTQTTWRIGKTYPNESPDARNEYRVDLRCQHNTYHASSTKKNTFCPATMYLVLKRSTLTRSRNSRNDHNQEGFFFHVTIKHEHNHRLTCADVLSQRDVSEDTVKKLKKLFESGHSPSSSLNTLKYDLQEEQGDSYVHASADRSIFPDLKFCFRLYYKMFKKAYGASSGERMWDDLQKRLDVYNGEQGETCAKTCSDGTNTIVAVCSPLMKRVHKRLHHSGEMVFIDSSGNCDRMNSRIFLLLTHSTAGGLPLGVVITTSESQSTISAGLKLLKSILPEEAFSGRGELGPQVVMSDCKALRQAVKEVYPETTAILCVFHMLQAMWRWLRDSHHGVPKKDRQYLLMIFKKLIYAKSSAELEAFFSQALQDPIMKPHTQFLKHLASVYERRGEWAICLRTDLPTRGNHTNDYVESAMRVLKDRVFYRLKAFNVTQLADFITTRLEAYYSRRLLDVANNRTRRRKRPMAADKEDECHCPLDEICPERSVTVHDRKLFHEIATGMINVADDCFAGLAFEWEGILQNPSIASNREQLATVLPAGEEQVMNGDGSVAGEEQDMDGEWSAAGEEQDMDGEWSAAGEEQVIDGEWSAAGEEQVIDGEWSAAGEEQVIDGEWSAAGEESAERAGRIQQLEDGLKAMFEELAQKLRQDESFEAAARCLLNNYRRIKTDSGLVSACCSFGKERRSSTAAATTTQKPLRTQAQKGLQTSTAIGVQPTAAARRKAPLGDRLALQMGRPPKRARR